MGLIQKIPPIGAAAFGLISLLLCATAKGDMSVYFIPLIVCISLGTVAAIVALLVGLCQERNEDQWTGNEFMDEFLYVIFELVAAIFFLASMAIFITTMVNGGLAIGDSYKTEHLAIEDILKQHGIGDCQNLKPDHPYCQKHKDECSKWFKNCLDKPGVTHAAANAGFAIIIIALVCAIATVVMWVMNRGSDEEGNDIEGRNESGWFNKSNNNTARNNTFIPGDKRVTSPLV